MTGGQEAINWKVSHFGDGWFVWIHDNRTLVSPDKYFCLKRCHICLVCIMCISVTAQVFLPLLSHLLEWVLLPLPRAFGNPADITGCLKGWMFVVTQRGWTDWSWSGELTSTSVCFNGLTWLSGEIILGNYLSKCQRRRCVKNEMHTVITRN